MNRTIFGYIITGLFVCASSINVYSKLPEADKAKETISKTTKESRKAVTPKIAFVNLQRIITDKSNLSKGSIEWNDLYAKIQKTIEPEDKELMELEDKFEKGRSEFEELQKSMKSGLSNQDALRRKYEEVGRIEMELRNRLQQRESFTQNELSKAQAQIGPKLDKIINQTRKNQGWDIILRAEVVLSSDEKFDITDQILEQLNKEYLEEQKAKKEAEKSSKSDKSEDKKSSE